MDDITSGGKAYKEAWAALPRDRKRAVSKAVQAGREVHEETAVAVGYAQRQIKSSWLGYVGIIALAFAINIAQGEEVTGNALTWVILGLIVLIGIYSYMRLFQARRRNQDLLAARATTPAEAGHVADEAEEEADIERLQGEGGLVTEVPEAHPQSPPEPPTPSAPATPGSGTTATPATGSTPGAADGDSAAGE